MTIYSGQQCAYAGIQIKKNDFQTQIWLLKQQKTLTNHILISSMHTVYSLNRLSRPCRHLLLQNNVCCASTLKFCILEFSNRLSDMGP
ncbi:MAG: hypothetical protein ACI8SR_003449 [Oceanicoccus sp.]|jgi:hypothetical protein